MLKPFKIITFLILFFLCKYNLSQTTGIDLTKNNPKYNFTQENYYSALSQYLDLYKTDSLNAEYNYAIGVCYLKTNIYKQNAIKYLEYVTNQEKFEPDALYHLANAYRLAERFDDAIVYYNKYVNTSSLKDDIIKKVNNEIQWCKNAKEIIKHPINISFKNLGDKINSKYPDFNPFVPDNEAFLIFTSKREKNLGGITDNDDFFISDIYYCNVKQGEFTRPQNLGNKVNTYNNDRATGLSANGNFLLINVDNPNGIEDIYLSRRQQKTFQMSELLDMYVNTQFFESGATLTDDGLTMYITRDKPQGFGGTDIYIQKKLPNGEWGVPQNLGENINTPYDEDFPHLTSDEKTLYFCSQGHNSIGGFDIFKSVWNEQTQNWNKPVNLGYPLNTPDDELNISLSKTGRYGYISACKRNTIGDLDIYQVTFLDIDPPYTVIKGNIFSSDSLNIFEKNTDLLNEDICIVVTEEGSDNPYGIYRPHKKTGKYVIILPPGNYKFKCTIDGYDKIDEQLKVLGKNYFKEEIKKDIFLYLEGTTPQKQEK